MYDELTTSNILRYLSQEEIFERYLGINVQYGKKFCNPLRRDRHPDCAFVKGYKFIFFTDYAHPEYSGNCFKICALYYGLDLPRDFNEVCRHINNDFRLGLYDGHLKTYEAIQRKEIVSVGIQKEMSYSDINVRVRPFSDYDYAYWEKYGISKDTLKKYSVFRADKVWINGDIYYHYQEKDLCFVYWFEETKTFKIYRPFERYYKWRGNSIVLQGYNQLPHNGDILFITSSLKDVMVLDTIGYAAIAPQGEGYLIPQDIIEELKRRFKRVIVFYDNDEPGVKNSIKITQTYDLEYLNIPKQFNVKDPSDFVEMYNEDELNYLIKQKLDGKN